MMKVSLGLKASGRALRAALLTCGLAVVVPGPGCNSSDPTCAGHIDLTCQVLGEECLQTVSCTPSSPRCGSRCEQVGNETACQFDCKWIGSRCAESCATAHTEAACGTIGSTCSWTGTECATPCAALATQEQCLQGSPASCIWITCDGKPQPCESYSGSECPTRLGCERVKHQFSVQ